MSRAFGLLQSTGHRVLGTWTQFADPDVIDLIGRHGFEFTIIDCEHGAFGIETAANLIRACDAAGVVPLVRVPRADYALAQKALDSGAAAIVAPGVESAREAQAWVRALHLPPAGSRGACPIVRCAGHSALDWKQVEREQKDIGFIPLIESAAGVGAATEIVHCEGVSAVMCGPFDLSCDLQIPGEVGAPQVKDALMRVVDAARSASVPVWMPAFSSDPEQLRRDINEWAALGIRHFPVGADKIFMSASLRLFRSVAHEQRHPDATTMRTSRAPD